MFAGSNPEETMDI